MYTSLGTDRYLTQEQLPDGHIDQPRRRRIQPPQDAPCDPQLSPLVVHWQQRKLETDARGEDAEESKHGA